MDRFNQIKLIIENIQNGVFVEIGTHGGEFADHILKNSTGVLYCIDPYIAYDEYDDYINEITGDDLFKQTKQRLSKYGDRVKFIRDFSDNAVNKIPDNVDLVYIDGNHRYEYVKKDLENYYPKVKENGYIIGDDAVDIDQERNVNGDVFVRWEDDSYGNYGVVKAFSEFCKKNNVDGKIVKDQYHLRKK